MNYKWKFRNKSYIFYPFDRSLTIDGKKKNLLPKELDLLLNLIEKEVVEADPHVVYELRMKLKDIPKELILHSSNEDYKLNKRGYIWNKKSEIIHDYESPRIGSDFKLDTVKISIPTSFTAGRQDHLWFDEIVAVRHDGENFVVGYMDGLDHRRLRFLLDVNSDLLDWISVNHHSRLQITESTYEDGYVVRLRQNQQPKLFLGRSGVKVCLTWSKKQFGREVDTNIWRFGNNQYEWEYDEKQSFVRRYCNGSEDEPEFTCLGGSEKILLDCFVRNPGIDIDKDDLVKKLWPKEAPDRVRNKRVINNLNKQLQGLARRLEPGSGLRGSTLIRNVSSTPESEESPNTSPSGVYRFVGTLYVSDDKHFQAITHAMLLPSNHHDIRDAEESVDLLEIIAHRRSDDAYIVLGYAPYFDNNVVLNDLISRFGEDQLTGWIGGYPKTYMERDGKMVVICGDVNLSEHERITDPSSIVGIIMPSGNILQLSWRKQENVLVLPPAPGLHQFLSEARRWSLGE